ncbi:uncharacterized protein LOC114247461 [Bombyx mandarina]|uniref:Uncharacterized protein LOC114247461 n=1 Tax=Bombyx mandarina TaxID=7092 RepID=A0A6J2K1X8_BOMMA|nr:uncharacterized protein LOC114247461 [Bombyx mandarina]
MFKLLLFLTLLTIVACCHHGRSHKCRHEKPSKCRHGGKLGCKGGRWTERPGFKKYGKDINEQLIEDLSRDLKRIDDRLRRLCNDYENAGTRELFGTYSYALFIPLPGVTADDIIVKSKYRYVYITARRPPPAKPYTEIKRLPKLVDASQGHWEYEDNELTVRFKYVNSDTNDGDLYKCGFDYKDSWITVPESDDKYEPNIDVRYALQNAEVNNKINDYFKNTTTPQPDLDTNHLDTKDQVKTEDS